MVAIETLKKSSNMFLGTRLLRTPVALRLPSPGLNPKSLANAAAVGVEAESWLPELPAPLFPFA